MRIVLFFGLILCCVLGCQSTPPAKLSCNKPVSLVLKDLKPGRSWSTPLDQRVLFRYHAMVEEKVVFTIIEWGEEDSYFLPPTSTAAGDVLPFEVSGDRFHFEVLAIGTSKADAIRIADMDPSWFENKKNYPEDIKYHVIRISPLPSS